MTEPLLNVVFFDGEKEYQLSEIENKPYFNQCYSFVSTAIAPIIECINNSDAYVYIDTYVDKDNLFKIKNKTEEIKDKLIEYNLDF
jgi:hypothetical protein